MSFPPIRLAELDQSHVIDIDLGDEQVRQDALKLMPQWAARPPFYCVRRGLPVVVCGRYNDAREVYLDGERFSVVAPKAPGYEIFDLFGGVEAVIQMEGERHGRVRRLMMPRFSPAAMNALKDDIQRIVNDKLDAIAAKAPAFDVMADLSADLITRVMLDATLKLTPAQQQAFSRVHDSFALAPWALPLARHCRRNMSRPDGRSTHGDDGYHRGPAAAPDGRFHQQPGCRAEQRRTRLAMKSRSGRSTRFAPPRRVLPPPASGAALLNLGRHPDQLDLLRPILRRWKMQSPSACATRARVLYLPALRHR